MIIDTDTLFSIGGQIAHLLAIIDEHGVEQRGVIQYDTVRQKALCYVMDADGNCIFDALGEPMTKTVDGCLTFTVAILPPEPEAKAYTPPTSGGAAQETNDGD